MKKTMRTLAAIVAVLTLTFALTACSNFNKIQKAYEKEGYALNPEMEQLTEKLYSAYLNESKQEELDVKIAVHIFLPEGSINVLEAVVILEFDCSRKKMKEYMEDEDMVEFYKDIQEHDQINGSCVFIAGSDKAFEIFQKA